jgi:hypothetical protein
MSISVKTSLLDPVGAWVRDVCKSRQVNPAPIVSQICGKVRDGKRIGTIEQEIAEYRSLLKSKAVSYKRLKSAIRLIESKGGTVSGIEL